MSDPTGTASPISIQTGFQDFAGAPLFGGALGRPDSPPGFASLFAATGKVIIRDDLFDTSVGLPASLKLHNPGQVIARFSTNSSYFAAIAHGVFYNVIMNPVMRGVTGSSEFITGTVRYTTWRLRGIDDGGTGHVFVGGGVGNDGIDLTGMYVQGPPPLQYILSADFTVGGTTGDCRWQVEVGFGTADNARATVHDVAATPEWPAFGA